MELVFKGVWSRVSGMVPEMWNKPSWERVWPYLDPRDSVRLRTASTHWNVPGKYGPHGEPMLLSELVDFGPCVSAETVKACALIGLYMMAEAHALRSHSDCSRDLGEMWRYRLPKKPCGAATNGQEVRMLRLWSIMHNVENFAFEVVG